jgi:hypothetical protein
MAGLNASSFDARGGIGLRGCGHADAKAARTVRRPTLYLRAISRADMPSRESRRIAANRSTFDIGGIGKAPVRPADAPTTEGGAETGGHRIHPIEANGNVAPELADKPQLKYLMTQLGSFSLLSGPDRPQLRQRAFQ